MKRASSILLPLALVVPASVWSVTPALADAGSASTPIGSMAVTIDGGEFTEECTEFPYQIVVTDAASDVQWSAEVSATRRGGGRVNGMETGYGSGTFTAALQICSGDGAGRWSARVAVHLAETSGSTRAYNRSLRLGFPISKATTTTTITGSAIRGGKTVVTGTVLDSSGGASTTKFGYVTIKVERPDGSWQRGGRKQVDAAGAFTVTVNRVLSSGTKLQAVFQGTEEAKASASADYTISP